MPKSSGSGDTISADTDADGVSAALGLGDVTESDDEQDSDEVDETDEDEEDDDEDPLEALRAELREQKRTIAQLKREAAQRRVAGKSESKGGNTNDSSTDGETVEQALERGREEARAELGLELAGASIRAALVGIIPDADLDDFVDDLRLDRYVGEDGKPDRDAIRALKDRQAKITRRKPPARTGNGRTNGSSVKKSKGQLFDDALSAAGL